MHCLPAIGSDEFESFVYCKPKGFLMDLLVQLEAAEDNQVSFTSPELNKPHWTLAYDGLCVISQAYGSVGVVKKKKARGWVVVEKANLKQYLFHSWPYLISVYKSCVWGGSILFSFSSCNHCFISHTWFACHLDSGEFSIVLLFFFFSLLHTTCYVIYSIHFFSPIHKKV